MSSFNLCNVTVKAHPQLAQDPAFQGLKNDFLNYIRSGKKTVPGYFGRDVRYERPQAAYDSELWHLHLQQTPAEEVDDPPHSAWNASSCQYYRTSNKFLVYTRGEKDRNCYIVLAIVCPKAHEKSRNFGFMAGLVALAEQAKAAY